MMICRPTPPERELSNIRLPAKKIIAMMEIGKSALEYIKESIFCRSFSSWKVFFNLSNEGNEKFSRRLFEGKKDAVKSNIF